MLVDAGRSIHIELAIITADGPIRVACQRIADLPVYPGFPTFRDKAMSPGTVWMFGSKRRSMIPTVCRTHLPIHLARIAPLIQVAAKTAGTVHRADVLIFVKSMIYIQGQLLTSFRDAKASPLK